jgi:flavin reductase
VSILGSDQAELSRRFAVPGPKDFSDLDVTTAVTGSPILGGAIAFLDCRVHEILPGGDHEIFVGEILAGDCLGGDPLLYYAGRYRRLAE